MDSKEHSGSTLEWRAQADKTVIHDVEMCAGCGGSLHSVTPLGYEHRQVHELPTLHLQVIEHQAAVKCCKQCQHISRGTFPADVTARVQYGKAWLPKAIAAQKLT